jgi:hypothetical protein
VSVSSYVAVESDIASLIRQRDPGTIESVIAFGIERVNASRAEI